MVSVKGIVPWLIGIVLGCGMGYDLGKTAGYNRAILDMAEVTPPPKTTDQQCVAWLFDANMRDVKKRVCK